MMKQILIPAVVSGTILIGNSPAQAATMIPEPIIADVNPDFFVILDDFTTPTPNQKLQNYTVDGTMSDFKTGLDDVLGGTRKLELTNITNPDPDIIRSKAEVDAELGVLSWANDSDVQSKLKITWDNLGIDLTDKLGVDIAVDLIDLDALVSWTFVDDMGNEAKAESSDLQSATITRFSFDEDFSFNENFDFASVAAIYLGVSSNGTNDVDARLDLIAFPMASPPPVVDQPEPSTILALLTFGSVTLFAKCGQNK